MSESSKWCAKEPSKMLKVAGNAVGQTSLEVRPDQFIGIKLRGVSWEVNGVESRTAAQEAFDELGSVERASIPEKNDRSSEMAAKMPEEPSNLFGPDVPVGIKARVEPKTLSLWRDRDGGDRRELRPASGHHEGWRLAFDRPGSLDVGDKRESALIQEGQAGSKPSGLFLYAATRDVSNSESLLPGAPWPSSEASGNSSLNRSSASRDSRYSNAPGSVSESSGRYASRSKDRSNNRLPRVLSPRRVPGFSFDAPTNAEVVLYSESIAVLRGPSSGRSGANARPNLKRRSVPGRSSDTYGPVSTSGRPDAAASPTFGVCREVSSSPPRFPLWYR